MVADELKRQDNDIFKLLSVGTNFDKKRAWKQTKPKDDREPAPKLSRPPEFEEINRKLDLDEDKGNQKKRGGSRTKRKRKREGVQDAPRSDKPSFEETQIFRKSKHMKVSGTDVPYPIHNFEDIVDRCGAQQALVDTLLSEGFDQPSPIQMQAIPVLADKRDVVGIAPTGSGKTLAFLLPIVISLEKNKPPTRLEGIRAVIVSPTKELAAQTTRVARSLLVGRKTEVAICLIGKAALDEVIKANIVLTTPLKLACLIESKAISLDQVEYLVLDEADRLFMTEKPGKKEENDISAIPASSETLLEENSEIVAVSDVPTKKGTAKQSKHFLDQIDTILNTCTRPDLVRGLFSATFPGHVQVLARNVLQDPVTVTIGRLNSPVDSVKQHLVFVGSERGKLLGLNQLIRNGLKPPILVFVDTKDRVKSLRKELSHGGAKADCIHADQTPILRQAALDNFRRGKVHILIATDVLGRGIDFLGVRAVVNFDFPRSSTDYIHRIGRTGRAGRSGEAYTLYTEKDACHLKPIANLVKESGGQVPDWILKLRKEKWSSKVSYGNVGDAPKPEKMSKARRARKAEKTKEKNMRKKAKSSSKDEQN